MWPAEGTDAEGGPEERKVIPDQDARGRTGEEVGLERLQNVLRCPRQLRGHAPQGF